MTERARATSSNVGKMSSSNLGNVPMPAIAVPVPMRSSRRTRAGVRSHMYGYDEPAVNGVRAGETDETTKLHVAVIGPWELVHDLSFDEACEIIEVDTDGKIQSIVRRHEAGADPPSEHCAAAMSYRHAITHNHDPDERKAFIKEWDDEFLINMW